VGLWGGLLFVAVGLILLGGSIIQIGLLGRWKLVPLFAGSTGLLAVAMPPWNLAGVAAWALFGLSWVALGCVLWSGETVRRPAGTS
jgi:apolipoprotein N-acyltransferase